MLDKTDVLALCCAGWVLLTGTPASAAEGDDQEALQNPAAQRELPRVVVIANAPLPGIGLPLEQVPGNVQSGNAAQLKQQQSLGLTEFLNNNFSGVSVNESQDNPFQMDVNYHGFTASPMLGTPQGLSVYVDGVRVNEAFGDTVNWDLIPESAISTISLISGSNPVFGLNTMGGSLGVQTKSGHDYPGTELQAEGGMYNRRSFEAQWGGSIGAFDYFLTGNLFQETGWRDLSPSKVEQLFGKVGYQTKDTDFDLSYAWANTELTGNGTTPQSMLAVRRQAIFSAPDFTHNKLNFINVTGSHFLRPDLLLSGNLYYRHLVTHTNNGDVNDDNYQSDEYVRSGISCEAFISRADVAYCANGVDRSSKLTQKTWGGGLQLTATHDIGSMNNQATVGVSYDRSIHDYAQSLQYATLTDTRQTVPIADPNNPLETVVSVGGVSRIFGAYISDTLSPNDLLHITVAARYNRIRETLSGFSVDNDVGDFGDGFDESQPVSGDHTYSRVNPSVGLTFTPSKRLTLYANYNESTRAPTVIELGCSNPDKPCGLPNEFASDPDLEQVISRTVEIGARVSPSEAFGWNVNLFQTRNVHDVQFVATSTSAGYFTNVGATRRQGLDLAFGGKVHALTWHLTYSLVDATYRTAFEINAESNSTADADGNIIVPSGARIPLISRHNARLRLDYAFSPRLELGGSVIASSGLYLHGDENNANVPDGVTILGSGKIGGYAVVNLQGTFHPTPRLDLFVKVTNLFDRRYATAGFLSSNPFEPNGAFRPEPDDWTHENAVSPAQPLSVFAGVRFRL